MKRSLCFVILTFLILICGITQPVNAADNTKENEILFFVENHANTAEATCVTFGKYCLLGIRTKGIILKSDNDKYIAEIEEGVKQIAPEIDRVYITTNLQETLILKDARKRLDEGDSLIDVYRYLQKKYPNQLDKIISKYL